MARIDPAPLSEGREGVAHPPPASSPGAVLTLEQALLRTAVGDRSAFAAVYRHAGATLFGLCLRIVGDSGEAEDVLQDVFVSVWRQAGRYDPTRARAMPWLIAMTRNRAIDRRRAAARAPRPVAAPSIEPVDPAPAADVRLIDEEQARALQRCLGELAGDDAGFIRTAFFEGVSYPALAERAAMPLGTIKSRIRRALLRLRDCLAT